jgi:HPt (histidine-containing phosphotransfer) domain-containing protein
MHGALSAAAIGHPALREFAARMENSISQQRDELVLFDRELFYAMQTQQRLADMIDQVRLIFA